MSGVYLRYDKMVEKALRGVVQDALNEVIDHGLPGDHHFYISFLTHHAGVRIPDYLRAQYKREMTIVLQFQFFDLTVTPEFFSVMLSFGGVSERLVIPYEAITTFADPAVNFALQFQPAEAEIDSEAEPDTTENTPRVSELPRPSATSARIGADDVSRATEPASEQAKVVTLDAFRKKP
jgi:uncharacterized protein